MIKTSLHQWAVVVICAVVALFGMLPTSIASETKDITIWAYDNWAKAAEKAVEIYQNNHATPVCALRGRRTGAVEQIGVDGQDPVRRMWLHQN